MNENIPAEYEKNVKIFTMLNYRKEQKPENLDLPETTIAHRNLVMNKPFLRRIYVDWYADFQHYSTLAPANGKLVEIGSGGGFLKEVIPEIISSDIIPLDHCDMTLSALDMPFENNSLSVIFMLDVFHHLPDAEKFLHEANRCLTTNGLIVMIEPANTAFSRLIYKNLHHEPFNTVTENWAFPSSGPLSDANGALPWMVFERDRAIFEQKFPNLKIQTIKKHTPFRYLLSGGLTYKPFVPDFMYPVVKGFEKIIAFTNPFLGMFQTIVIKKNT